LQSTIRREPLGSALAPKEDSGDVQGGQDADWPLRVGIDDDDMVCVVVEHQLRGFAEGRGRLTVIIRGIGIVSNDTCVYFMVGAKCARRT
jgi:hypothetical protein